MLDTQHIRIEKTKLLLSYVLLTVGEQVCKQSTTHSVTHGTEVRCAREVGEGKKGIQEQRRVLNERHILMVLQRCRIQKGMTRAKVYSA
jgi:hypothetical protein